MGVGTDLLERLSSSLFTVCFESSLKPLSYAGRGGYSLMAYKGRLLLKWITFFRLQVWLVSLPAMPDSP